MSFGYLHRPSTKFRGLLEAKLRCCFGAPLEIADKNLCIIQYWVGSAGGWVCWGMSVLVLHVLGLLGDVLAGPE